jgi:hypothetical protein
VCLGASYLLSVHNSTFYTEWQRPLSGVHSIIMEKLAQGRLGCTRPFWCALHLRGQIHSPYFDRYRYSVEQGYRLSCKMSRCSFLRLRALSFLPRDPHVFGPTRSGSISQRYGSGSGIRILLSSSKNSKKNLDSYFFVTSLIFWTFYL